MMNIFDKNIKWLLWEIPQFYFKQILADCAYITVPVMGRIDWVTLCNGIRIWEKLFNTWGSQSAQRNRL